MTRSPATGTLPRFMSLRWQALIALSLVLFLVNGTLAYMAYQQANAQYELQQSGVRENQIRQLRGLVARNFEEMTRLVNVIPLLGPETEANQDEDVGERLRRGLESEGTLLGLEWDLRSIYWLTPAGRPALVWPVDSPPLGPELIRSLTRQEEGVDQVLACQPECLQYLSAPLLWRGQPAGTLVLGRSLADALLTFHRLTGAEVAIFTPDGAQGEGQRVVPGFPAMTHPDRTAPIIQALAAGRLVGKTPSPAQHPPEPLPGEFQGVRGEFQGDWHEVFRVDDLAPGVSALVVDEVTAETRAIQSAIHNSILLGIGGLILSGSLLLWLGQFSVRRLRRVATALPLLAESRYAELREILPQVGGRLTPNDELDQLSQTAQALTDRMEQLQHDREEAESRLVWMADHDPLTRLHNRRRFNEDFQRILDQAQRYGHQGAVLFLDLDQFKDINDLSGHQVGDLMLRRIADQLTKLIRPSDLFARLGGDEFALVLPECDKAEALVCAERLQRAIRGIEVREHARIHRVTATVGIALFPDQGHEPSELLANADIAMFQGKEKGTGRIQCFAPEDKARELVDARVTWRDKISEGLRADRFQLHFQPIVAIATGTIHHWEVLLRLRDPGGNLVHPDRFIPVAEKSGQILAIDHWVMAQAVQRLARDPRLRLSINLSGRALDDPALLADVERLLGEHPIDPSRLIFEVTETAAVNSLVQATELMGSIQRLGCRFALDDFGSGYASYAYLRQLPVAEVKIDGAFIRDLEHNREDRIFVKAIADMAHGMGKRVTAEFVENEAIYRVLHELGVDHAQGYFLGKPEAEPAWGPFPAPG